MTDDEIDFLVDERDVARMQRDFNRADEIKEQLLSLKSGMYHLKLLDEPNGTFWYWSVN